ncbi:MAG: type IX secretion system membrane protein PorP/SprF [Saprospiraceae bacterium]|nr:type IX secretion system membrane protein PorP/SprF [Saprospiraceae bacterium]
MRKTITLVTLLMLGALAAKAQQDPMFTKYMFNSLIFNPAYAGSRDHATINLLHRTQWWGIDGAPTTQSLTMHTPLKNERVGVGFSLVNDKIGPTNSINANASYAYRIPIGKKGKLAVGIQGGVTNWRADWTKLNLEQGSDPPFSDNVNWWKPNIGAGLHYYTKNFYTGLGVPRIIEYDLIPGRTDQLPIYAKQVRHYFYTLGGAIPLKGNALIFKPSLLVKASAPDSRLRRDTSFQRIGAPTEFNVDLSLFFQETLWIGASFRSSIEVFQGNSSYDSADLWAAYYLANGLRIGASYDYTLTKLQQKAQGSFEVMLGYEFDYKTKRVVTPRYF